MSGAGGETLREALVPAGTGYRDTARGPPVCLMVSRWRHPQRVLTVHTPVWGACGFAQPLCASVHGVQASGGHSRVGLTGGLGVLGERRGRRLC